jgi:NAD(P)-dependent dehydrogenase (short-subunit alcohol dehydrogenase family)
MDLSGRVALITGAARRVGREIALALAQQGADLLIHYNRSGQEAHDTIHELRQLGVRAEAVRGNLGNPLDIERIFVELEAQFGRVDVLVNNASSFEPAPFLEMTVDQWNYAMGINLRAPFLCGQRAAHLMLARNIGGVIINIADVAGVVPWVRYPQHSVSKAGLLMLTKVMAKSLGPLIRVNAVVPGPVLKPGDMPQHTWERIGEDLPLFRTGSPENVAQAVMAIVENDFMTGSVLTVDGGDSLLGGLDFLDR